MGRLNGGEVLIRMLAHVGIREFSTVHGGHLDSILMAAREHGFRITDPVEELAYATLPYLLSTGAAVGALDPDGFARRYAEGAGFAIDPEALFFWQVLHHALYVFYFTLLIEGARQRGVEALEREETAQRPRIAWLLDLIEAQLASQGAN